MMTRPFFRTLSFSAAQNWAQNNGAKRRDDINSRIMDASCCGFESYPERGGQMMTLGGSCDAPRPASGPLGAQKLFRAGFLDPVDHAAGLVMVAKGLGKREA